MRERGEFCVWGGRCKCARRQCSCSWTLSAVDVRVTGEVREWEGKCTCTVSIPHKPRSVALEHGHLRSRVKALCVGYDAIEYVRVDGVRTRDKQWA